MHFWRAARCSSSISYVRFGGLCWDLVDQSVVSLQKKRVRRENGNDDGQEKSLAGWKHVVLSFMLILSFTILLAMCAKSKSK